MSDQPHILYCHCAFTDLVPEAQKTQVLDHLRDSGLNFDAVPDLCGLIAQKEPKLPQITEHSSVTIIACYPRAVRWMLTKAGIRLDTKRLEVLNMREQSAAQIIHALTADRSTGAPPTTFDPDSLQPHRFDKKPWFPVIDYDRCTDCRQCLEFCLFGVYTAEEDGKVNVTNPTRCKTDCPACARLCSEAATIFPKHKESPINGDEVRDEDQHRQAAEADLATLANSDVRTVLRERSARRFSPSHDPQRALKEREQCAQPNDNPPSSSDNE